MAEVFLMEDSGPLRRVLSAQLRNAGHNVIGFEHGLAGSDIDLMANAEVLVTDIAMPFVDGEEVIHSAQARFPDLPIIVISGEPQRGSDQLEVFGRLRKPFSEHSFTEMVQKALHSRQNPVPV